MINRKLPLVSSLILIAIFLSSCSWFRIKHVRKLSPNEQPLPAKSASLNELVEQINVFAESTNSLKLNVIYQLSGGSGKKGEIADYRETEGFILLKKPGYIRLIGLAFKVTVFDMVSDGKEFHIYVPPKNKFIVGLNEQPIKPRNDIPVNLRPQHLFSALMVAPLQTDSEQERLNLEEDQEGNRNFYIVTLSKELGNRLLATERKIWIDRFDLRLVRQKYYDSQGRIRTDVIFNNFQKFEGKDYPSVIDFHRPQEQYSLRIKVSKATINPSLKDDQFVLQQPQGSELVDLTKEASTP
ncbi:MAG: DUF4292 domain-containing protein [Terriglobia bacterium]